MLLHETCTDAISPAGTTDHLNLRHVSRLEAKLSKLFVKLVCHRNKFRNDPDHPAQ